MAFGSRRGVVERFDPDVGLGYVAEPDGSRWMFHCTAIADGSRRIDEGAEVRFELSYGGPGHWEAFAITG